MNSNPGQTPSHSVASSASANTEMEDFINSTAAAMRAAAAAAAQTPAQLPIPNLNANPFANMAPFMAMLRGSFQPQPQPIPNLYQAPHVAHTSVATTPAQQSFLNAQAFFQGLQCYQPRQPVSPAALCMATPANTKPPPSNH